MSWTKDLPHWASTALKQETSGEIVRWVARPDPRSAFVRALGLYLFAFPWLALSLTIFGALVMAALSGKPPSRPLSVWDYWIMAAGLIFTGAFVAVGLGMLAYPFYVLGKWRRMVHAITDKRLVTIVVAKSASIKSYTLDRILKTERRQRANGSGTLKVVTGYGKDSDGDQVEEAEMLYGVPRVAEAERWLLRPTA